MRDLSRDAYSYRAELDHKPDETPCGGCGCGWSGRYDELSPIEDCSLTPGDESPAGRCPVCDALAYVEKALRPALADLIREGLAYEAEAFAEDSEVSGADLVDWFSDWRLRLAAAFSGDDAEPERDGMGNRLDGCAEAG